MPARILVVDDETRIALMISTRLMANGYEVVTASGGEEALLKASQLKPDAVVADIMMPGMDGGDLAHRLRERPEHAGIPIIFLSALVSQPDLESQAAQRQYFLPKPFAPGQLLEALKQLGL